MMSRLGWMFLVVLLSCREPQTAGGTFRGPLFEWQPDGPQALVEVRADTNGAVRLRWQYTDVDLTKQSGIVVFAKCDLFSLEHWDCREGSNRVLLDGDTLRFQFEQGSPLVLRRAPR